MEELKSSGALRYSGNTDLAKRIVAYDALKQHMLDDYEVDKGVTQIISSKVNESINMNYSNYNTLAEAGMNNILYLTSNKKEKAEYEQASQELNKVMQLAERDTLALLTSDITTIHKMVNGYLKLRRNLNTRASKELPQLKEMAKELIDVLKTNYVMVD